MNALLDSFMSAVENRFVGTLAERRAVPNEDDGDAYEGVVHVYNLPECDYQAFRNFVAEFREQSHQRGGANFLVIHHFDDDTETYHSAAYQRLLVERAMTRASAGERA